MNGEQSSSVGSASYATFGPFNLNGGDGERLGIGLSNAGPNDLTEFIVDIQDKPDDEFYTLLSGTDYGATTTEMPFCSTHSPATLANGNKSHFHLSIPQASSVRFRAKSGGTAALSLFIQSARP